MRIASVHREISSVHAAALILGGSALASKLLGLLRDRLLASRFGAGDALDAYYAAFLIPDVLYTIFLIGAASAAVLPVFLERERQGPHLAEGFISNLLTLFSLAGTLAVLLAIALAPWLTSLVAPGFGALKLSLATSLSRLMMVNALFLGLAGILSSVLQARHRFLVFALPPVFYNLGSIIGIVALVPLIGVMGLAVGVLLGGLMQILVQAPTLAAMRFRFTPSLGLGDPGLWQVVRTSLPRVAALSMSQVTLVVLAAIASYFASGSITVFKFAQNLFYVPVSLFGVSYALAIFPKLSSLSLAGRGLDVARELASGMRAILFWALPFGVLLVVLRAHVVRVVLGAGAFDWEDTRLVAALLAVLSVAVVSESLLPLILRAFYALARTWEPLLWDVAGSASSVLLAFGFGALFAARPGALENIAEVLRIGDLPSPRIVAVALGFSMGSLANIAFLLFSLRRVMHRSFGMTFSFEAGWLSTMLGAAVLAGLAAYGALLPFPSLVATNTFLGILLQGAVAGVVGFLVYGAALAWQKNPEVLGVLSSLRRRLLTPARTPEVFQAEPLNGSPR